MVIHSPVSGLGFELTATVTSTVLSGGQNLTIVAQVNNTLSSNLKMNTTSMSNPAYGPCQQEFAATIQVFSGNYSYVELFNNRSQPTPLLLYNPSLIYTCPRVFSFAYTFHPDSAIATIQPVPGGSQQKNETRVVKEISVVGGYWSGAGQDFVFHRFQPGSYTVVVFDAWGDMLIGYFHQT